MDNQRRNRIFAREVLIFFSSLVAVGLTWLVLIFCNEYWVDKTDNLNKRLKSINSQIESLPADNIKALYESLKLQFVVNYAIGESFYAIPKEEEADFLKDFPDAKLLPNYKNGYSYFRTFYVILNNGVKIKYSSEKELGKKIKKKFPEYKDISDSELVQKVLKRYSQHFDSTVVFDFVDFEKFRLLIKNQDYRDRLFERFSNELNFETKKSFDSQIKTGLNYAQDINTKKEQLNKEKYATEEALNKSKINILGNSQILKILLLILSIIVIIIYPLRFCLILIVWSIRILKTPINKL